MKFAAQLDVNVVAHEAADEVTVLLDVEAPVASTTVERAPSALQVVLDRSGSMSGAPLEGAKRALVALVHRLDPTDSFGLVTFDDQAQVVVPTGPLSDKAAVVAQIMGVHPGGTTDLGAGLLRGLREVRRAVHTGGATVLVVSDGHVNAGLREPAQFGELAAKATADGLVVSTLGYGEGYDETLLSVLARHGSGNHVFAADPDAAGAAIAREVDGLLDKVVQAATLTVQMQPAVEMLRLYNDLPAQHLGDGKVMIELGDLYAGEQRKLLLRLQVPALESLGLAEVARLELQYVELPGLLEHTVSLPISVNVVPGDQAAGRVADPTVRSEVLFQEAQDAKRKASEAFERGDLGAARASLASSVSFLDEATGMAAPGMLPDLEAERDVVTGMSSLAEERSASYMSKLTRESYHRQNRKRGRRED